MHGYGVGRGTYLLGLFALLVTTLFIFAHPERAMSPDTVEYFALGESLCRDGSFTSLHDPQEPEVYRTPGYPLLLAATRPWESIARYRLTIVVHAILIALTSVAIKWTTQSSGSRSSDLYAGLFLLQPAVLVHGLRLGTEALFTCLLAGIVLLLFCTSRQVAVRFTLAGLLLGLAVLVRPIGLVLLVPALIAALVLGHNRFRRRSALCFLIGALLLPTAWTIRNGTVGDYWGVSKTGMSFVSSIYGTSTVSSGLTDAVRGAAIVLLGPGEFAMRRFFLGERGSRDGAASNWFELERTPGRLKIVSHVSDGPSPASPLATVFIAWSMLTTAVVYLLTARGAWQALCHRDRLALTCLAAATLLILASAGYQANARFRVPVAPLFLVVAACCDRRSLSWGSKMRKNCLRSLVLFCISVLAASPAFATVSNDENPSFENKPVAIAAGLTSLVGFALITSRRPSPPLGVAGATFGSFLLFADDGEYSLVLGMATTLLGLANVLGPGDRKDDSPSRPGDIFAFVPMSLQSSPGLAIIVSRRW